MGERFASSERKKQFFWTRLNFTEIGNWSDETRFKRKKSNHGKPREGKKA